jgi:hypothetical protein
MWTNYQGWAGAHLPSSMCLNKWPCSRGYFSLSECWQEGIGTDTWVLRQVIPLTWENTSLHSWGSSFSSAVHFGATSIPGNVPVASSLGRCFHHRSWHLSGTWVPSCLLAVSEPYPSFKRGLNSGNQNWRQREEMKKTFIPTNYQKKNTVL